MYNDSSPLHKVLDAGIQGLGYELLGIEQLQEANGAILRVYIDHERGIALQDCETVSRHISGLLDVEDLVRGKYTLEVSSPGLDRPLFKPEHYRKFAGSMVKIRLSRMLEGRRRIKGTLCGMDDQDVIIKDFVSNVENGDKELHIPFSLIDKGRIVPDDI